jgi:putative transposase
MTRARLDDTTVTLTVSDSRTRVPDDGLMRSATGPRADQPRRRTFTAEYKLAMVAEYDRLPAGEKGALLRREGLYSSHIIEWRRARDAGTLTGPPSPPVAAARRGSSAAEQEIERLRRQNERLAADLARNRAALEIMGKAHAFLQLLSGKRGTRPEVEQMIEAAFAELQPLLDTKTACDLLGKSRATHYRRCRPTVSRPRRARRPPANALSGAEREQVLAVLRHDEFVDKAPAQVWATLLDEGQYLCSESTMYRILRAHGEVRERRAQATHPAKVKPELVATAPGEVFSWDITKLQGPSRGQYFHLYVMLDIFSRYVVGWTVAATESAALATEFIADITATHGIPQAIHADRGTSMTSKPVAQLLADLGVARSHSRPRVSNDNPYSEAQFRKIGASSLLGARHRFSL